MSYIDQIESERDMWKARCGAAEDVLLCVEEYIGYFNEPREFLSTSEYSAIGERKYLAMSAAYRAYRASIEAATATPEPQP